MNNLNDHLEMEMESMDMELMELMIEVEQMNINQAKELGLEQDLQKEFDNRGLTVTIEDIEQIVQYMIEMDMDIEEWFEETEMNYPEFLDGFR